MNYQEVMCPIGDRFYAVETHLYEKKTVLNKIKQPFGMQLIGTLK
jgi:hypothetical protein